MNIIRIFDLESPAGQRKVVEIAARKADMSMLNHMFPEGRRFLWLR